MNQDNDQVSIASKFTPSGIVQSLLSEYGKDSDGGKVMDLDGLMRVYKDMRIFTGGAATGDDHHHHAHHQAHDQHDHFHQHSDVQQTFVLEKRDDSFDTCLYPNDLISIYNLNTTSGTITQIDFELITPALVYISTTNICQSREPTRRHDDASTRERKKLATPLVWIYSFLANTVVTIACMSGMLFVPLMKKSPFWADMLMALFVALGAGTLIADALLHFVPLVLGLHSHNDTNTNPHSNAHIWKLSIVMLGIYLFWAAEQVIGYLQAFQTSRESTMDPPPYSHRKFTHMHSHAHHTHSKSKMNPSKTVWGELKTTKPVAILILIGDSLHNFVDGLAIGVGFAYSDRLGVTTSIAVLMHELPHELGDYAILLSSGLSPLNAALLNAASNLSAFIGTTIGILLTSTIATSHLEILFAIAAGTFLYISIAGLLPELKKSPEEEVEVVAVHEKEGLSVEVAKGKVGKVFWQRVLVQHVGFVAGWGIMVLLALYEE
ncbi:hypothetical protein HDU97_008197 [Phlyctochytrium planicorne]|nr:hypothetical protein HDU97_008197 [Phlyctochytrium planicorne]